MSASFHVELACSEKKAHLISLSTKILLALFPLSVISNPRIKTAKDLAVHTQGSCHHHPTHPRHHSEIEVTREQGIHDYS
ncbi:MAG: hypothetical protein CL920_36605 [Deltaproteobacteria bacterium]|nr:hypothetical protein [Deltaproteobacteria bacterium]MBU54252.1 hypothetical protein [Deltaproteobacteria bacterium]